MKERLHKGLSEHEIVITKKVRNQILKNGYLLTRHGITLYYDEDVYEKGDIIHLIGFDIEIERKYYIKELKKYVYVTHYIQDGLRLE